MSPTESETETESSEIERYRHGNTQAFECLYGAHAGTVLAFLTSRTRNKEAAEEISQAVWTKVWHRRNQFDGGHFKGWLFQIARNELASWGRGQAKNSSETLEEKHDIAAHADLTTSPERLEELNIMHDCMQKLSQRLLEIITRVKLREESPEDVAVVIGTSRGQIDKDVHRAKQLLRDCMEKKLR